MATCAIDGCGYPGSHGNDLGTAWRLIDLICPEEGVYAPETERESVRAHLAALPPLVAAAVAYRMAVICTTDDQRSEIRWCLGAWGEAEPRDCGPDREIPPGALMRLPAEE